MAPCPEICGLAFMAGFVTFFTTLWNFAVFGQLVPSVVRQTAGCWC